MKVSALIELVMQLATQEAVAAEFGEIAPEHLLMGLLKFAEFPVEQGAAAGAEADAYQLLSSGVEAIRKELAARAIDGTQVRRKLRARLGKGDQPHKGRHVSRSPEAREVFDRAGRLADARRDDVLEAEHLLAALLESPTAVMTEVLGNLAATPAKHVDTPLLNEWGKDLVELSRRNQLPATMNPVAGTALVQVLAEECRPSVFLVTESPGDAQNAIQTAAAMMASNPDGPIPPGASGALVRLRGHRLFDVRGAGDGLASFDAFCNLHAGFWSEAERSPGVILIERFDPPTTAEQSNGMAEIRDKLAAAQRASHFLDYAGNVSTVDPQRPRLEASGSRDLAFAGSIERRP